ncbi:hypothetical protein P9112_003531 [Eukaryota sp. TZLM1-RC]
MQSSLDTYAFSITLENASFKQLSNYFLCLKIKDKQIDNPQVFRTDVSENTDHPVFKNRHFSFTTPVSSKTKLIVDVLSVMSVPKDQKKGQAKVLGSLSVPLKPVLTSLSSSLPHSANYSIPYRSSRKGELGTLSLTFFYGSLQHLSLPSSIAALVNNLRDNNPTFAPISTDVYIYSGENFYSPEGKNTPADVFITLKSTKSLRDRIPTKATTKVVRGATCPFYITPLRLDFSREEVKEGEFMFIGVVLDSTRKLIYGAQIDTLTLPSGRRYYLAVNLSHITGDTSSSRVFLSLSNTFDKDGEVSLFQKYPSLHKLRVTLKQVVKIPREILTSSKFMIATVALRFDSSSASQKTLIESNSHFVPDDFFLNVVDDSEGDTIAQQVLRREANEMNISDQVSRVYRTDHSIIFDEVFFFAVSNELLWLPSACIVVNLYTSDEPSLYNFSFFKRYSVTLTDLVFHEEKAGTKDGSGFRSMSIDSHPVTSSKTSSFPKLTGQVACWNALEWIKRVVSEGSLVVDDDGHITCDTETSGDFDDVSDSADSIVAEKGSILHHKQEDESVAFVETGRTDDVTEDDDVELDKLVEEVDQLEQDRDRQSLKNPRDDDVYTREPEKVVLISTAVGTEPLDHDFDEILAEKTRIIEEIQQKMDQELKQRRQVELDLSIILSEKEQLKQKNKELNKLLKRSENGRKSQNSPIRSNESIEVSELRAEIARLQGNIENKSDLETKYLSLKKSHSIQNQALLKLQEKVGVLPSLKEALSRQQLVIEKLEGHIRKLGGHVGADDVMPRQQPVDRSRDDDEFDGKEVAELQEKVEELNTSLINNAREFASSLAIANLKISKLKAKLRAAEVCYSDESEVEEEHVLSRVGSRVRSRQGSLLKISHDWKGKKVINGGLLG